MRNFAKIGKNRTFWEKKMKEQNENVDQSEIIEKSEEENQDVVETEMDAGADTVEKTEETSTTEEVTTEEETEAVSEESDESAGVSDVDTQIENMKKNDAAKMMVNKAKIIVKESEDQMDECKLLLASDLEHYEAAKQDLKDKGMDASEALLSQLGYEAEENSELDEDIVVFEPKEEVKAIRIEDVSSGAFTGFIMALIAGAVTLIGMVFLAMTKLNISWYVSTVFTKETLTPVIEWYAALVNMAQQPMVGAALIGLTVLLVMWIVYKIRVSTRASRNLSMAKEQLETAETYSAQKGTCKDEMDKVDAYIHDAIKTLKTFQVVLHEQEAKLERIYHIEHDKIETSDFHHKSNAEMKDTQELINVIKEFMSLPMSEEGKLSGKSSLFLHRAKAKVQKVLDRLY